MLLRSVLWQNLALKTRWLLWLPSAFCVLPGCNCSNPSSLFSIYQMLNSNAFNFQGTELFRIWLLILFGSWYIICLLLVVFWYAYFPICFCLPAHISETNRFYFVISELGPIHYILTFFINQYYIQLHKTEKSPSNSCLIISHSFIFLLLS
jgi:hypothetical protein